jgi:outer membrane protein assembly factor BamB
VTLGSTALALAFGLAACTEVLDLPPEPAPWVYPPDLPPWPPPPGGAAAGEIGRGPLAPAPQPAGVIAGHRVWADEPLDVRALWAVPGDATPARAIASGLDRDAWAVEAVDVDAGVVRWRDLARCAAEVAHVSPDVVVCSDAAHAVALAVDDGRELWRKDVAVTGATGELLTAIDGGEVVVLDAHDGRELARAALADLGDDAPRAACRDDGGFDVFTWGAGPVRRYPVAGGTAIAPVAARWSLVVGGVLTFDPTAGSADDACDELVLAAAYAPTPAAPEGEAVVAIDRARGTVRGGPVAALGHWPARNGGGAIEVATGRVIERRGRDLGGAVAISDAAAGALVASRGTRRLVRGRTGELRLLDADTVGEGVLLGAPVGVGRAVLGDRFVLAGPWHGIRTDRDALRRYPLPTPSAAAHDVALAPAPVDDPTRYVHPDVPAPVPVDVRAAIERPDAGTYHVAFAQLDPEVPTLLYALPLEQRPSATLGAGVAALDLRARRWLWVRPDGCPPGTPTALAVAPDAGAIVCAARAFAGNSGVRATARVDGRPLWSWSGPVDTVVAGGRLAAIVSASKVVLLDAATGEELDRFAADDGWKPRLAFAGGMMIDAERGAVVGRVAAPGLLPRWSVRVRGTVLSIAPAGDRVAVALTDGELYLVDPATGAALAAGAWSDAWRAPGGGDLAIVAAGDPTRREWRVAGYGTDGVIRFRTALAVEPAGKVGDRGRAPDAPLAFAYGPVLEDVALLDPHRGALRGVVALPERAVPGLVFATVVDGKPVGGAVLSHPLAVVTF